MKKAVIVFAALALGTSAMAQKAKVYTAKEYMDDGDMKKAVIAINEAVNNESSKVDGDAWFTRGQIYEKLSETDPTATTALDESAKSYLKVLEVKPNYNKELIDSKLMRIAYKAYNSGVLSYAGDAEKNQASDFNAAISSFQKVIDIREVNDSKHFAANKKFDTIAAQALKFQALSAFYAKNNELAITTLTKAKNNPVARDPFIYSTLVDIYTEKKDFATIEKLLDEAKAIYPKNAEISRQEMNYYSRAGKTEVLVSKMEEAVKTDPDNPLLQYNLGVLYGSMANPLDENGKPKTKPANSKELEAKAEKAYKMAIDADPNKPEYQYNLGALYFNNAADITTKMQEITGTSDADNKKYDALKALRTAEFTKSLPYFQNSYNVLNAKNTAAPLNADDDATYRSTLMALQNIYEELGQKEKADEMGKKLAE